MSAPPTLSATWQEADDLRAQGHFAAARDLLEPAADVAAIRLGPDDPAVVETQRRLATVHREMGELTSARRVLEEALDGGLLSLGEGDPLILLISAELGAIADELGNKHEARRNLARVARHGPGVLGADHPYVRTSQRYLGIDVPPPPPTPVSTGQPGPQPAWYPTDDPAGPVTFDPPVDADAPPAVVPVEPGVYRPAARDEQVVPGSQATWVDQQASWVDQQANRADQQAAWVEHQNAWVEHQPGGPGQPPTPGQSAIPVQPPMPGQSHTPGQSHVPGQPTGPLLPGTIPAQPTGPGRPEMPTPPRGPATPTGPTQPGTLPIQPGTMPTQPGTMPTPPGTMPNQPGTTPPPGPVTPDPMPSQRPSAAWYSGPVTAGQIAPDQASPNQAMPGQSTPGQAMPGQIMPDPRLTGPLSDTPASSEPYDWAGAAGERWDSPADRPARSRGPLIAMAIITLAVVAAGVVIGVVAFDRPSGSGTAPPASSSAPAHLAPGNVRLRDDGVSITLTWADPASGRVPFVVAGGRAGEQSRAFQTLPAGQTAYTVNGLNPALDYCFTVVAVYNTNEVATSALACTQRGATGTPSPGR